MSTNANPGSANRAAVIGAFAVPVVGIAFWAARRAFQGTPSSSAGAAPGGSTAADAQRQAARRRADEASDGAPSDLTDPANWSPREVRAWLRSVAAGDEVVDAFARDDVDGATLPLLLEQHLVDMGIGKVSQRVKTLRNIRLLFGMPTDTASMVSSQSPAPSSLPSPQRDRLAARSSATDDGDRAATAAAPPARPVAAVASGDEDEDDEGDEVMLTPTESASASIESGPAVVPRGHTNGNRGAAEAVTTVAGKLRAWFHILTSDDFKKADAGRQIIILQEAAKEITAISAVLNQLPGNAPAVAELRDTASQLTAVIGKASEAVAQRTESQERVLQQGSAGVLKVADLLEQFQKVLTAPDLLRLPQAQRAEVVVNVEGQLRNVASKVLPSLPEQHRQALASSIDSLLKICAQLQDPDIIAQLNAAARVRQQNPNMSDTGSELTVSEPASPVDGAASSEAGSPQHASLKFIVLRMRQIFDNIKSPEFLGETNKEQLKQRIAAAAREVHRLSQEGEMLPDPKEREVVRQVAANITGVLGKLADVAHTSGARRHVDAAAGTTDAAPAAPPRGAARPRTSNGPETREELEVAQLLSKQLVAMLNVLKSEDFERAPVDQRARVAMRMQQDLDKTSRVLAQQPADVREMLAPTRDKLQEFLKLVMEAGQQQQQQQQQQPANPAAAEQRQQQQQSGLQQQQRSSSKASGANSNGSNDGSEPSAEFLRINTQMKEILAVVNSEQFKRQPPTQQLDIVVQCQQVLGRLVSRVTALGAEEQQVSMHNAQHVNQLLKRVAEPLLAAMGEEENEQEDATSADEEQGEAAEEIDAEEEDDENSDKGASQEEEAAQLNRQLAQQVVQRTQALFQSINAEAFLDAPPSVRAQKAAAFNRELLALGRAADKLTAADRANVLPLLNSLAAVLSKLGQMAELEAQEAAETQELARRRAELEAEEEEGADGEEAAEGSDAQRADIYRLAENTTAALENGRLRVASIDTVEQLSQILTLLNDCGCRNEKEIRIRENFQAAVEAAIQALSQAMNDQAAEDGEENNAAASDEDEEAADNGEEDEEMEDEPTEDENPEQTAQLGKVLATVIELLGHARSEEDIARVLPSLTAISRSKDWVRSPENMKLLMEAANLVQAKRRQFAEQGGQAGDAAVLLEELSDINDRLPRASREELQQLMQRLTDVTDRNGIWKADPRAVALVNNCIRGIQAASRRLEPASGVAEVSTGESGEDEPAGLTDSIDAPPEAKSEADAQAAALAQMLREAARHIRAGADASAFVPLVQRISGRMSEQHPLVREAMREFQEALMQASTSPRAQRDDDEDEEEEMEEEAAQDGNEEEEEEEEGDEDGEGGDDDEGSATREAEDRILEVLGQVRARLEETASTSASDLSPYAAFLAKMRTGTTTPRVQKAIDEIEQLIQQRTASLRGKADDLRSKAVEMKRNQMKQLMEIVAHPSFAQLDAEVRQSTLRKGTQLLNGLSEQEHNALRAEASLLIAALDDATTKEDALVGREHQVTALADLSLLPRIVERLGSEDFVANCTAFEIKAIASTLSRLDDEEQIAANPDFKQIVHQATRQFGQLVTAFDGETKSGKDVACPLSLTGMVSEADEGEGVVRYTLFSPEEAEDFTVNEEIAGRFSKAVPAGGDPQLPEGGVAAWRGKSAALIFCFDESPVDKQSTNDTAQAEVTQLADLLESTHGFEVFRCNDVPTPMAFTEAFAQLASRELERLFIYIQEPVARSVDANSPPQQHAVVFPDGKHIKHRTIVQMGQPIAKHIVLFHDYGNCAETVAWTAADGLSPHVGVSVTEAAFLVANASRCWLYDGLVSPTVMEALCCDARTLCAEDLINNLVRTLAAKDGCDGPHMPQHGATAKAFFAPGLEE